MRKRPPKPDGVAASPRYKGAKGQQGPQGTQTPRFKELHAGQRTVPDVSLTHQKFVGRVIVVWAKLEAAINDAIWQILRLETEDGRVMTAYNDTEENLTILQSLAKRHLTDERFKQLKPTFVAIKTSQQERNMIVHGTWGTLLPEGVPLALHIRKKIDPGRVAGETFSAERMQDIADRIVLSIDGLVALIRELSASPDKQPRRSRRHSPAPDAGQ